MRIKSGECQLLLTATCWLGHFIGSYCSVRQLICLFFFPPTTTSNNLNIPGLFNKAEHPIQLWKLLAPGCPLCHMSRLRVGQLMGGIWLLRRHYWPLNAWQKREKKSLLNNNTNGTLRAHNRSAGCHSLTLM